MAEEQPKEDTHTALAKYFLAAMGSVEGMPAEDAIARIDAGWNALFLPFFVEAYRFSRDEKHERALRRLLTRHTSKSIAWDADSVSQHVWTTPLVNSPHYARFKQLLYGGIDPLFRGYFEPDRQFEIRLDEVIWGGVKQDGIPPLRSPAMLTAREATYLRDSDVVFGLEVGGDARAYPQRILAWHEMFVDTVGGVPLAGVYCTLCGTVVVYETELDGVNHELGTSGFLYRSNKLMYDRKTQSLWSTMEGRPVIGPLVGQGIRLKVRGVITTTWGEWKQRHPETTVLSIETGHKRDYREGAAYRDYFATDNLMFQTPFKDRRLKNKAEVLVLRFEGVSDEAPPLAISAKYLRRRPVYEGEVGGQSFVVLTDKSGGNRVYARSQELSFAEWDQRDQVIDSSGQTWKLSEQALIAGDGRTLRRLPAHRAFWFGWFAAHPDTRLVK